MLYLKKKKKQNFLKVCFFSLGRGGYSFYLLAKQM